MELATIFAAVMLIGHSPVGMPVKCTTYLELGGAIAQDAPQDESPQNPPSDLAAPKVEDQRKADNQTDNTPAAQKAEEPKPEKPRAAKRNTGRKRRAGSHKSAVPKTVDGEPHKVVVHQGSVSEPRVQILPGLTEEEASHQRESAEQLLGAADTHLKELAARTLNLNQQGLTVQIRQYMDGARSALKESDFQRAHTLALKAYLLSDDLVKH